MKRGQIQSGQMGPKSVSIFLLQGLSPLLLLGFYSFLKCYDYDYGDGFKEVFHLSASFVSMRAALAAAVVDKSC